MIVDGAAEFQRAACSKVTSDFRAESPAGVRSSASRLPAAPRTLPPAFALIHFRGLPHAQTLPFVQQRDPVGKFRGQIQFVRHHHHGVAIFIRQPAQAAQQFHFAADIQVLRGLIEQQQQGCCASARARITRCFSPPESWSIQRSRNASAPTCASAFPAIRQSSSDSKRNRLP